MTLADLRREVAQLDRFHPLTPTSVESVEVIDLSHVDVNSDVSHLTEEIEDLRASERGLEKELAEAHAEKDGYKRELDDAKALLAEIGDEVCTVAEYRDRALNAEQRLREARSVVEDWKREITALRRKKGIYPAYFSQMRHVTEFLTSMSRREWACEHGPEAAAKLLKAITAEGR